MQEKKFKSVTITSILSLISLIGLIGLFVALIFIKGGTFNSVFEVLKDAFSNENIKTLFIPTAPSGAEGVEKLAYCIATYVLILLIIGAIVWGIIISKKKHRLCLIPGMVASVFLTIPVLALILGLKPDTSAHPGRTFIFDTLFNKRFEGESNGGLILVLTWIYVIFIVLSIAFFIATYIAGLVCLHQKVYDENLESEAIQTNNTDEQSILAELEEEPLPVEESSFGNQSQSYDIPDPVVKEEFDDFDEDDEEDDDEEEEELSYSEEELKDMLKGLIREAIKEEITKQNTSQSNGPSLNNGGPIIVQYFNQNGQPISAPSQAPYPYPPYPYAPYPYPPYQAPVQTPKEQENVTKERNTEVIQEPTVKETVSQPTIQEEQPKEVVVSGEPIEEQGAVEEIVTEEVPVEEHVEEPQLEVSEEPVPEEPVVEQQKENNEEQVQEESGEDSDDKIVRVPFMTRIVDADESLQSLYNELKNYLLSYGLKSRVAAGGDTFRLHRKTYCRISVAGKSLKLHLALNPDDYADSKMPFSNAGDKAMYSEIPFVFKVKSSLSLRRAKDLIDDCVSKDDLIQIDLMDTNWVDEIRKNSEVK